MKRTSENGVALILALLLITVLSIMGISLMFLSQSETWSSLNYRYASQARDAAESGINSAANYLMFTYAAPGTVADPMTGYNVAVAPVQSPAVAGSDVILSASN